MEKEKTKNQKENYEDFFKAVLENESYINGGYSGEEGFASIAALLSLSDESFDIISETFILELEKQLNDSNIRLDLINNLKQKGITIEQVEDSLDKILEAIDEELSHIPQSRRDFLKRIITLGYNAIIESSGSVKKIISIPIELCNENAKIPTYANDTDAGLDIYALEDITINPGETVLVKTGLKVAIPIGYELQVRPKSGRSLKTKLRVANTPGTIDSGYRDEIGVILENIEHPIQDIDYEFDEKGNIIIKSILHGKSYFIAKGEKFAQLVLNEVPHVSFYEVDNIGEIEGDRGGGFGSTGVK